MKQRARHRCPARSEVSLDATLREEGSFSEYGDRLFGAGLMR
jgi:hypothetical protein